MTQVLMVIIYLVLGYGAMWLMNRQDETYRTNLIWKFKGTDYNGVQRYTDMQSFIYLRGVKLGTTVLVALLGILVWAAWPVTTIVAMIMNRVFYQKVLKEGRAFY